MTFYSIFAIIKITQKAGDKMKERYYFEILEDTMLKRIGKINMEEASKQKYQLPQETKCVILKKITELEDITMNETELIIVDENKYQIIEASDGALYICSKDIGLIMNCPKVEIKQVSNHEELQKNVDEVIKNYTEMPQKKLKKL